MDFKQRGWGRSLTGTTGVLDREGNARKVVNCSCVVVKDWGSDSQERSVRDLSTLPLHTPADIVPDPPQLLPDRAVSEFRRQWQWCGVIDPGWYHRGLAGAFPLHGRAHTARQVLWCSQQLALGQGYWAPPGRLPLHCKAADKKKSEDKLATRSAKQTPLAPMQTTTSDAAPILRATSSPPP